MHPICTLYCIYLIYTIHIYSYIYIYTLYTIYIYIHYIYIYDVFWHVGFVSEVSILGCDGFECEISARQQGYASVQQYMGMNAAMCHGRKMLEKISDNLRTCWRKLVKNGENYKIWWCQYIMVFFYHWCRIWLVFFGKGAKVMSD